MDKVHDNQTNSNKYQTTKNDIFTLSKQAFCEQAQNLRKRKLDASQNDGTDRVENEQVFLRSVIRKKTGKQRFAMFARSVVSRVSRVISTRS